MFYEKVEIAGTAKICKMGGHNRLLKIRRRSKVDKAFREIKCYQEVNMGMNKEAKIKKRVSDRKEQVKKIRTQVCAKEKL